MHYSCAFWHGIPYRNKDFHKINGLYFSKFIGAKCDICQEREGCCIGCFEQGCKSKFHVECAR